MSGIKDTLGDNLFEPSEALARNSDPITSKQAAQAMDKARVTTLEQEVMRAICSDANGIINDDVVRLTGLEWKVATPRVKPLRLKGYVTTRLDDTGREMTRVGQSNRRQTVWFPTAAALLWCKNNPLTNGEKR